MASTVVQSGDYLLELGTGWNWNGFRLGDYATKVTRTNLMQNPSFETNTTSWGPIATSGTPTLTRITSDAYVGSACLQVTKATGRNETLEETGLSSVTAGLSYTVSGYMKVPTGNETMTAGARALFFTNAGATVGGFVTGTTISLTNTSGWQRVSVTATAPATAQYVRVYFGQTSGGTAGQQFLLDAVLVEESSALRPYFDGSYSEQWVGYDQIGPTSWTGTANASTSTGQWGLISSATGDGVLNGTTYVLDGTESFADITEYANVISYSRGRRKSDYQFGAGVMNFSMRDETGILGPYDSTSPYYDPNNNEPGLAPMRPVRLSRDGEYLFTGIVTGYTYEFALAGYNTVNVQCADEFYKLAQTQLDEYNVNAETSGQRITSVLALPEVDYSGTTSIATGTVNLGHDASYTVPQGTNTLAYLTQINDAEQGRLFVARDGTITFQERIGSTLSGPVLAFADDGVGAKYEALDIEFDADNVVNRAYVGALDGKEATDTDTGSIAKYFIQGTSITNSLLHVQGEIDALAAYLLEPDPAPRYTSVTTWFGLLSSTQRDDATTIDIGDTISIKKTIPGLGTPLTEELAVEGIQGVIDVNRGHRITYYTSPTTIVYQLILNDATYGVLDANNVLG